MIGPADRKRLTSGALPRLLADSPSGPVTRRGLSLSYVSASCTANAAANTKGLWSEIIAAASLTEDMYGLWIHGSESASNRDYLVDIGVGEDGAEAVLVSNLQISGIPSGNGGWALWIPIYVYRGTRVAIRCQSSTGSTVFPAIAILNHLPTLAYRSCEAGGPNTADSGGLSIDPGGTINTYPASFTELIASSSKRARAIMWRVGNQVNSARSLYAWTMQHATGAAGSEATITYQPVWASSGNDWCIPPQLGPLPCDIPAGTRISARSQCNGNDATDRLFDLSVYLFSDPVPCYAGA